ncbi:MAG TPA: SIS domain-containing protein [Saprospiraceae bacterium]|nr:SIS domain-containing protein [Saprospiraceae bacterium]
MEAIFSKRAKDHAAVFELMLKDRELMTAFDDLCMMSLDVLKGGGKILLCGNGGSAADAQHIAAELTGRYLKDRKGIPAMALHSNSSHLTAVANDYGYEETFARMVEALGRKGDLLIALSTSGNSANILRAADQARKQDILVAGWTGQTGGRLKALAELCLRIPSGDTARIQEMHIFLGHILCEFLENKLFPE